MIDVHRRSDKEVFEMPKQVAAAISGETNAISVGEGMQQRALQSKPEFSRQRIRTPSKERSSTFKGMAFGGRYTESHHLVQGSISFILSQGFDYSC